MAVIIPFRGVRYNTQKAGEMTALITPPYDVINEEEQKLFYEKSPYNVIRLEYGESRNNDSSEDNRYTRAAGFFQQWLQEEILLHEHQPALYLYEQEFNMAGKRLTRSGLIAGVGLEEYETGNILPHEETLPLAKADRLQLLRHCQANFSPIYSFYDDPAQIVEKLTAPYKAHEPALAFRSDEGDFHRLWVIGEKQLITKLQDFFSGLKIYIADGHHRYETALQFKREMNAQGSSKFDFCLMTLVNLHDPGLVIFPTHRLIRSLPLAEKTLLTQLAQIFTLNTVSFPRPQRQSVLEAELAKLAALASTHNAFLLYLGGEKLYQLTLGRSSQPALAARYHHYTPAWCSLDVNVLNTLIFADLLGIDSTVRARGDQLQYTRDAMEALTFVDNGTFQAAFFLNPTQLGEITAVAAAGEKMPQKSTYFYPKLITGLVINDFTVE